MSLSLAFSLAILSIVAQAAVPASKSFTFINQGSFGEYDNEYGANYRNLFDLQTPIFALCFYNTTPNAYTLGLRMGSRPEDSTSNIMRWVWDANRGNPVRENATLTLGRNGNLVLADADRRVVWQTNTANKGVVGLEILPNGNVVLVNSQGQFVWQSFDYPTDSLLVGQGLRVGGTTQLVSRVSNVDGSKGPYSLVLEKSKVAMYLKSKNSPNPILYYTIAEIELDVVEFTSSPDTEEAVSYDLTFFTRVARPKYNATLSFLRLESDGNLKAYTYYDKVIWQSWEITYSLFDSDGQWSVSECRLPSRCGSLGVCMNNQCVGCPTPKGLWWWNETCASPKLPSCKAGTPIKVYYYKVVGVEHFTRDYTEGDVSECRSRCSKDCGCLGFFYREESSKCLLAPVLGTLTKVSNQSHVAFIKISN